MVKAMLPNPVQRKLPFGPAVALDAEAELFFAKDPGSMGRVYALTHGLLMNVALKAGSPCITDAEDAASDAILYVQAWERRKPKTTGAAMLGMLTWAAKIMAYRQKDQYKKYLSISPQEPEGDEDIEYVEDLEGFEERRIQEGADTHEYLTSIETDTPEEIVLRENLREFMERKAIEACGQRHWDIYYKAVVLEESQREIAEAADLSQQRVSQIVREVGSAVKAALIEGM